MQSEPVSYGKGEGAVFKLDAADGLAPYSPGYLIIGEHLVIGTTSESLEVAADMAGNRKKSLSRESEYRRLVDRAEEMLDFLAYVNIRDIREAAVAALAPPELGEYERDVEPFLAVLLASDTSDGAVRFRITITVE